MMFSTMKFATVTVLFTATTWMTLGQSAAFTPSVSSPLKPNKVFNSFARTFPKTPLFMSENEDVSSYLNTDEKLSLTFCYLQM